MMHNSLKILSSLDGRIPTWSNGPLTFRSCPLCKCVNDPSIRRPDLLPVARCRNCHCWYVSELPSPESITEFYDGYFQKHRWEDRSSDQAVKLLENANFNSRYNEALHHLLKLWGGVKPPHLFEVGCGNGSFLLEAQAAGASVSGCDISPEACEFVSNKLGIAVYDSDLLACAEQVGPVDIIVMRDFIEHPINPKQVLDCASGLLSPGGLLFIHTPNGGEATRSADAHPPDWSGFRLDLEHLQYLSADTIRWVARQLDMEIVHLTTSGCPRLRVVEQTENRDRLYRSGSWKQRMKQNPVIRYLVQCAYWLRRSKFNRFLASKGSYHLITILRKKGGV